MAEDPPATPRRQHGHSRAYILDRLRRENRADLADAIERDEVSAFSVAVSLGWTKRPPTLAAVTHQARKRQHRFQAIDGSLSAGQMMELQYGNNPSAGSLFGSREELERAWQQARERLLEGCRPGRRVMAWWEFESTVPYPGYGSERSALWRMGLLSADEKDTLEREWKAEFETAQAPDFTLHDGTGILMGDCARAAHYRWADIPNTLIKRWSTAARRRRAKAAVRNGQPVVDSVSKSRKEADAASILPPGSPSG